MRAIGTILLLLVCGAEASAWVAPLRDSETNVDWLGDPLPPGAIARFGTNRLRIPDRGLAWFGFTSDGKQLLTLDNRVTPVVKFWDAHTGKELRRSLIPSSFSQRVPESGGCPILVGSSDGDVVVYNAVTGKELMRKKRTRVHNCLSPDAKILASAAEFKVVELTSVADSEVLRTLEFGDFPLQQLEFSPDGKYLAVGGYRETTEKPIPPEGHWQFSVRVWETNTGKVVLSLTGKTWSGKLGFCDGGKSLMLNKGDAIRVYNLPDGKDRELIGLPDKEYGEFAISPDNNLVAIAARNGVTHLWNRRNREIVHSWKELIDTPMMFTPDGKYLVGRARDNETVRFLDVKTGKLKPVPAVWHEKVTAVALSRDDRLIALGHEEGLIRLVELNSGTIVRELTGHTGNIEGLLFTADGQLLASCSEQRFSRDRKPPDNSLRFWRVSDGKELHHIPTTVVRRSAFAVVGEKHMVVAGGIHGLRAWDMDTGKKVELPPLEDTKPGHAHPECQLFAISADGKQLAVHMYHRLNYTLPLRVIDFSTAKTLQTVPLTPAPDAARWPLSDKSVPIRNLAFHPGGNLLAVMEFQREVRLQDVRSLQVVGMVAHETERKLTHRATFSWDGQLLATSCDSIVRVWELTTKQEVFTFQGHEVAVTDHLFSSRGDRLITRSFDSTALVWDLSGKRGAASVPSPQAKLEQLWKAMQEPTASGFHAGLQLLRLGEKGMKLLAREMRPVPHRDTKRIAALVRLLDSDERAERENASKELATFGPLAHPELRAVLTKGQSAEASKRARVLLALPARNLFPEELRSQRAVRLLELAGTADARKTLERLAGGEPLADLTQAAAAVLKRWPGSRP